jgi:hypothetical protein
MRSVLNFIFGLSPYVSLGFRATFEDIMPRLGPIPACGKQIRHIAIQQYASNFVEVTALTALAEFFRGADTHLGIFSPRSHLIALFPDLAGAQRAERNLLDAGFPEDEVIAAPGEAVVELVKEHAQHSGVGTFLMQQLSRMFETEEVYADHDFTLASRGAGFLAVHAHGEAVKQKAWKLIEPANPTVARHYTLGGVEHLKGET